MTRITFTRKGGELSGFRIAGHSGYAVEGEDVVCAALTSAVRYLECVLNDALAQNARFIVDANDTAIELLPQSGDNRDTGVRKALLDGLLLYFRALQAEYPNNIEVMEV